MQLISRPFTSMDEALVLTPGTAEDDTHWGGGSELAWANCRTIKIVVLLHG